PTVSAARCHLPRGGRVLAAAAVLTLLAAPAAAQDKTPPYWASIASGEAMMRTGPGKNYPGVWLYKRRDLPIRVVKTYPNWRLIEDPDGTKGWMLVTLLSDRRTAIVKPGQPRAIHAEPADTSRVRYRAEPGVVGRIEKCANGWCRITIAHREGHIRIADIWGVGPGETIE
ncbi:SH3 domain-containing protein, partial [Sphingomonas sp.]|uniref:SH3 domain-containing protein n=1 Tax=Sphingomonas sp. TaxID=28214 RepID=UPI00286D6DD7